MKKIFILTFLFLPLVSFAEIPAFPMAFWGEVTVNGVEAPVGTIVRVYDEDDLVGEVTVEEAGVYGYTEPTKQKLLVTETAGVLQFAFQEETINGGVETKGEVLVSHPEYVAGETIEKNLNFVTTEDSSEETNDDSGVSSGGSSSGGGGSSRSRSTDSNEELSGEVLGIATSSEEMAKRIELQKQIIAILTQLILLLKLQISTV